MTEISSQITAGAIAVWAIQRLKEAGWFPWLSHHTDLCNRIASVIMATATNAGIDVVYAWSGETLTLTLGGLTMANVLTFLWSVANSAAMQELIYRAAVKPNNKGGVE